MVNDNPMPKVRYIPSKLVITPRVPLVMQNWPMPSADAQRMPISKVGCSWWMAELS